MAKKKKKMFVLDTNVMLHDYTCIFNFEDNDVVIPIVALEELDKFKRGNDILNYNAREFTRELDALTGDKLFNGGVSLGENHGKLKVETGKIFSEEMLRNFPEKTPDHRILAIAEHLHKNQESHSVFLITKDINLRMKAKSIGINAQDYENDKVRDIESIDNEILALEGDYDECISQLYQSHAGVPCPDLNIEPKGHEYYILKGVKSSILTHYNLHEKTLSKVEKHKTFGIDPRNAEQTFALSALLDPNIQLVSLTGKAGTGKTLLALAAALQQEKYFDQILLARPIVPLANRDIGFLPGDAQDKIKPYMQPLFDNLSVIKHKFKSQSKEYLQIEGMLSTEKLLITPLAYIRGRSLSNVFFIIDEAQNLTPHEIKTIITRAGEGTKMVFTGDIHQIDSPYLDLKSNGLSYMSDKMTGQELFAHINLVKGERSYLAELASNLL